MEKGEIEKEYLKAMVSIMVELNKNTKEMIEILKKMNENVNDNFMVLNNKMEKIDKFYDYVLGK